AVGSFSDSRDGCTGCVLKTNFPFWYTAKLSAEVSSLVRFALDARGGAMARVGAFFVFDVAFAGLGTGAGPGLFAPAIWPTGASTLETACNGRAAEVCAADGVPDFILA